MNPHVKAAVASAMADTSLVSSALGLIKSLTPIVIEKINAGETDEAVAILESVHRHAETLVHASLEGSEAGDLADQSVLAPLKAE